LLLESSEKNLLPSLKIVKVIQEGRRNAGFSYNSTSGKHPDPVAMRESTLKDQLDNAIKFQALSSLSYPTKWGDLNADGAS